MGSRLARLRRSILLQPRVKEIQNLDDAGLRNLPPSSRYLLAPALRLLAGVYAAASGTRRFLYRHGLLRPTLLPAPVVSIGNLTQGGTGKTPFVEFLARHFATQHRLQSMILQCGGGTVDETVMLRQLLEELPVHVQDSYSSMAEIKSYLQDHPDVRMVLLDDGLQHLPLVRDMEIVMVNSLSPFGNGHLLPRGTLRELPKAALRRADAVVLHHADLAGPDRMEEVQRQLGALSPKHTVFFRTQMQPMSLRSLIPFTPSLDMSVSSGLGKTLPLSRLEGAAVVCLVGIGMPSTVEGHLRALGVAHVEGCGAYEDHHMFTLEELQAAISRVEELQRNSHFKHVCLLMTEKDYARQHGLFDAVFSQYAAGPARQAAAAMSKHEAVSSGPWWDGWASDGWGSDLSFEDADPYASAAETISSNIRSRLAGAGAASSSSSSGVSNGTNGSFASSALSSSSSSIEGAPSSAVDLSNLERSAAGGSSRGVEKEEDTGWGAYVLHSGLAIAQHDPRLSSANAVLAALLRMTVDKFRQRSYLS